MVGGFNPSEKYESQLVLLLPIHGKIKHVPKCSKPPTRYIQITGENTPSTASKKVLDKGSSGCGIKVLEDHSPNLHG
jgi:hypothetical protein